MPGVNVNCRVNLISLLINAELSSIFKDQILEKFESSAKNSF